MLLKFGACFCPVSTWSAQGSWGTHRPAPPKAMQAVDDVELEDLNHQLVVAAKDGDDARVAALIDRGADCNATHALGEPGGAGYSAVYWAARGGHLSTFLLLKSKGADVLAAADNGITPLMAACAFGFIQIARELKDAGADPGAADTPTHAAATPGCG